MKYNVKRQVEERPAKTRVHYKTAGNYPYTTSVITDRYVIVSDGEALVEIDIERILKRVSESALLNKSGRATLLSGAIKAKRTSLKEVSRTVKPWGRVPEGATVLSTEELPS